MDAQTRRAIDQLAHELQRTQAELARVRRGQRGPQLAHSSIDTGALEVRDGDAVRARIGWLPDGTVGMITEGGDPVSAPSAPIVTPSLGGLRVTWDGTLSDDLALPGDFDHMAVHVSTTSGFEPSAATYVGTIRRAGEGGMLPVVPLPYVEHYVRLVPVTTGGVQGVPSAEVAATPHRTSGVDLEADSIEAVHIKAGAVEADKLEAVLALVTTIIAGIPGAARVEMDQDGLRGYNAANEVIFAIDSAGNAVFSGNIVGSEITGSRMIVGSAPNAQGYVEASGASAQVRATSPAGPHAQVRATASSAEYSAWASTSSGAPVAGMVAQAGVVALAMQSVANDFTQPYAQLHAESGSATGAWRSASGAGVVIQASPDYASILLPAPEAADPDDAQSDGYIFTQRLASDIAAITLGGPVWEADTGPEYLRRANLFLEGARPERPYTRVTQHARRFRFSGEWDGSGYDPTSDGVVDVASTHSVHAPRHAPLRSDMVSNPSFGTTGEFVPFTAEQFPPIAFRTSWSGHTRITITAGGYNGATSGSGLDLGFSLSGGGSVPAARSRSWITTSGTVTHSSRVLYMNLAGNMDYTLTPAWRISSGDSSTASFVTAFENSIVVEPLM